MKIATLVLLMFLGPQAQQKPSPVSPGQLLRFPCSSTMPACRAYTEQPIVEPPTVESRSGRVDRLSNEEYKRLTDAEAALAKVKTDIAAAHGVQFSVSRSQATCAASDLGQSLVRNDDAVPSIKGDTYEFRGQFLLVDIPEVR